MTRDDIIRMAREAKLPDPMVFYASIERFAALVAAAERERIESEGVSLYEKTGDINDINTIMIQRSAIRAMGQQ